MARIVPAVPETVGKHDGPGRLGDVDGFKVRDERVVMERAGERRRDDGDGQKKDVEPDAILKFRSRLPGPLGRLNGFVGVRRGIHLMEL